MGRLVVAEIAEHLARLVLRGVDSRQLAQPGPVVVASADRHPQLHAAIVAVAHGMEIDVVDLESEGVESVDALASPGSLPSVR